MHHEVCSFRLLKKGQASAVSDFWTSGGTNHKNNCSLPHCLWVNDNALLVAARKTCSTSTQNYAYAKPYPVRLLDLALLLFRVLLAILRKTRAGLPATMAFCGTSLVTTLPAPMIAFSPMVTLLRMVDPEPTEAPFLTRVGSTFQSSSVCKPPVAFVARGYESLINVTL